MFLLRKLSEIDSKTPIPPGAKTAQPNQSTMSRMVKSVKSASMVGKTYLNSNISAYECPY